MALNLVTTCDLVTIRKRPFFNLLYEIIRFSDALCDLVTVFAETKSVTISRLHCKLTGLLILLLVLASSYFCPLVFVC